MCHYEIRQSCSSLVFCSDIDGLGSSAIGGQLIRRASSSSFLTSDKKDNSAVLAGIVYVFSTSIVFVHTVRVCVHTEADGGGFHKFLSSSVPMTTSVSQDKDKVSVR